MTESEKSKYYVKINSEPVQQILQVTSIPTIFYFQYNDKFTFRGEYHEAWEFSFINNGEIEIINEGISHFVKPCQIYIHKPMSFHQGRSNGVRSSSFVISFLCDYKPLYDIADRVITLNKSEQDLVKYFYDFALATREKNITKCWFSNCIDNKITEFIGSEQVLKNIFEILLLSLLNNHRERQNNENDYNITQKTPNTSLITIVNNFIKKNIMKKITIKDISNALHYSESYLCRTYKKHTSKTIIEAIYFEKIKIAQEMISDTDKNLSLKQISETLEFDSVQYFTHVFKKVTGLTPGQFRTMLIASNVFYNAL